MATTHPMGARQTSRAGMAGLIVTVIVLGFLMMVSLSTILMVRTESQATGAGRNPDLAQGAALTGIFFYQALLLGTDTTFLTGQANNRRRLHFLANSTKRVTNVASQQIATGPNLAGGYTYSSIATSAWMFASGTTLFTPDCPDIASSSIFMLKTYAYEDNGVKLASYVFVKSIGCYREIEENQVIASYYAQLNARLLITPASRAVDIDQMRKMVVQYPDTTTCSFATSLPAPWPW